MAKRVVGYSPNKGTETASDGDECGHLTQAEHRDKHDHADDGVRD